MDKEVQGALIQKCKRIVESTYVMDEQPIKMADIHDLLLKEGIPFNILYKVYHVQEGRYLFYDKSVLLIQLLSSILIATDHASRGSDAAAAVRKHFQEKVYHRCYRVNKHTGAIDIYDYDTGVVLFERRKRDG